MPEKVKRSFYLPDGVDKQLNEYVAANYSGRETYGAWSSVVSQAISCFCSNMNNRSSCGVDVNMVMGDFMNNINKELGIEEEVAYEEAKEKAEGKRRVMTPDEVVIWKYQNQKIGTDNEEVKEDV